MKSSCTTWRNAWWRRRWKSGFARRIGSLATPYVTLVIADLLGVPKEDHATIFEIVTAAPLPGSVDDADAGASLLPLAEKLGRLFAPLYRRSPRQSAK